MNRPGNPCAIRSAILLRAAALLVALCGATPGHAAELPWPERSVRLVVPSPGGSGIDVVARVLAQRLTIEWGKPVIVDNRAGANSLIGAEAVARSAPDGHTLLFASDSTFTLNPHIYARLPYDPIADFRPVLQIVTFHQLLVAHPSLGVTTLAELIARAKARPAAITYASWGAGSQGHLLSELLKHRASIDLLQVPYKGFAPAVAAVVAGESMLTWAGIFSTQALVRAGRLKALGVAGPKRSVFLPEVPTFAELGMPEIDYTAWFGVFAPAGTSADLVARLSGDFAALLRDPEMRDKKLLPKAYEPSGIGPREFSALIVRELAQRAAMVRISGAVPQ